MPHLKYLRLDGRVQPHQRQDVVTAFNTDVSINLLLLTTHIGGLGLNLTGNSFPPINDAQGPTRSSLWIMTGTRPRICRRWIAPTASGRQEYVVLASADD
jgi:hypothetical protein